MQHSFRLSPHIASMLVLIMLMLTGCFFNRSETVRNIVKDFNLAYRGDSLNQALYVNIDHTEYGGLKIVDAAVFAVGWNQDFIVALQYPDSVKQRESSDTVFYIIDFRHYSERLWGPKENVYRQEDSQGFLQMKRELGVPDLPIRSTINGQLIQIDTH